MEKNKILIVLAVALVIIAAGAYKLHGKPNTNSKGEVKKVKVVYSEDLEEADFLMSFTQDKNFFGRHNLEVEKVPSSKATETLMAGGADIQVSGPAGQISAYLGGGEPRLLANAFKKFVYFGVSRFPREELKNIKKAAVKSFGKEPQLAMDMSLMSLGIDPGNVNLVAVPSVSAKQDMLDKGEVDFISISSEKALLDSGDEKKYTVLEPDEMQKGSYLSLTSIMTTKKIIEEKPEAIKSFVSAIYESLEYVSNNQEETVGYIRNKYGFSKDVAEKYYNRFLQARKNISFVPDVQLNNTYADMVKKEFKLGDANRNVDGFIYADFAKEAVGKAGK